MLPPSLRTDNNRPVVAARQINAVHGEAKKKKKKKKKELRVCARVCVPSSGKIGNIVRCCCMAVLVPAPGKQNLKKYMFSMRNIPHTVVLQSDHFIIGEKYFSKDFHMRDIIPIMFTA